MPEGSTVNADPRLWWLTACQLALLALLGYGIRRNGWRALFGWLAFLVLFLAAQYSQQHQQ